MSFNFHEHSRESALQTQMNELMQAIQLGGNLGERFDELRRRHKLDEQQAPVPEFQFRLNPNTYDDVRRHCSEHGINLRRVVLIQADRFYCARNYELDANDQIWDVIASSATVDLHQESSQLTFLDDKKTVVDWADTLARLNRMIDDKPYSEEMMKNCLLRFIGHYESSQSEYLRDRTANEIANFLLSLNTRIDRKSYHKSKLMSSVRIPSETLSSAVHKVRNIAEKIYVLPAPPPVDPVVPLVPGAVAQVPVGAPLVPGAAAAVVVRDIHPIVNRILINAIISFTNDEIAVPLNQEVMNDSANSRLRDYSYYLRDAMSAEIRLNSFPSLPLRYSRKLPGVKTSISSLNSITVPETHPCFRVPSRKSYPFMSADSYFPHNNHDQFDPLHQAEGPENQDLALVPHMVNQGGNAPPLEIFNPFNLENQYLIPPFQPQIQAFAHPQPAVIPPPPPAHAFPPLQYIHPAGNNRVPPPPALPARTNHGAHGDPNIPIYNVEGPNVLPQIQRNFAGQIPAPLPPPIVHIPAIRTIPWNEIPPGVPINTTQDGTYIWQGGERCWIDVDQPTPLHHDHMLRSTLNNPRNQQGRPPPPPTPETDTPPKETETDIICMLSFFPCWFKT